MRTAAEIAQLRRERAALDASRAWARAEAEHGAHCAERERLRAAGEDYRPAAQRAWDAGKALDAALTAWMDAARAAWPPEGEAP